MAFALMNQSQTKANEAFLSHNRCMNSSFSAPERPILSSDDRRYRPEELPTEAGRGLNERHGFV
jgi:hypothetical protein